MRGEKSLVNDVFWARRPLRKHRLGLKTEGCRIRGAFLGASGSLGPLLGRSRAPPGPSRAVPGSSWAAPMSLWGRSGWLLGLSWAGPGPLLTSLGLSWAPLGPLLGLLWGLWGRSWKPNATLRNLIKTMGFIGFCRCLGLRGPSRGLLGASWRALGPLGGSWAALGPSLSGPGWLLARSWAVLSGSEGLGRRRTSREASQVKS